MPHKQYHGKTGRIWDVAPHSVGVELTKRVGPRVMLKRIHVRIEHVRPSNCRKEFLERKKHNDELRRKWAADPTLKRHCLKRMPGKPREGLLVKSAKLKIEKVVPARYTETY
eukprot:TRINITY_DN500_c0_g1_i2.p2 TRINITY_DN500_c0_g1~~TRINITY_DN500_c0_g1_i2.p2  ORF type:complete len:112 (-),score=31.14 TRINITY_DN500_c0_g1_i2:91-426(-)